MESDDYKRWRAINDQMMRLVVARDHEGAIALLEAAVAAAIDRKRSDEAASYSGLLSTAFAIACRDEDALQASEDAERLDPENVQYKLTTARVLLSSLKRPDAALAKAEEALSLAPPGDPFRYAALAVLGMTRVATRDTAGALAAFRENSSSLVMARLRQARYAGVYDLGLVSALIEAGVASGECEVYLREVRDVALSSGYSDHAIRAIEELLGRIRPSV